MSCLLRKVPFLKGTDSLGSQAKNKFLLVLFPAFTNKYLKKIQLLSVQFGIFPDGSALKIKW